MAECTEPPASQTVTPGGIYRAEGSLRALLKQVESEHYRALALLQKENAQLRQRLSLLEVGSDQQEEGGLQVKSIKFDVDSQLAATDKALVNAIGEDIEPDSPDPHEISHKSTKLSIPYSDAEIEKRFRYIDIMRKGTIDATDIKRAMKKGEEAGAGADLLIKIQDAIRAVQEAMPVPEGHQPGQLGFDGFKYMMLVENVNSKFGDELGETIKLVREGCDMSLVQTVIAEHFQIKKTDLLAKLISDDRLMRWLEVTVSLVILLNAISIGASLDLFPDKPFWEVLEVFFTVFFVLELMLKVRMVGFEQHFMGDDWQWSWFDLLIVLTAAADVALMAVATFVDLSDNLDLNKFTIARLARLVRITRIVRIMRFKFFKELTLMINGVIGGLRTLFWAFVLFFVIVYVTGILMREITREYTDCSQLRDCTNSERHLSEFYEILFGTVFRCMFTVFRCFTDGCSSPDGTPLIVFLWDTHGWVFILGYTVVSLFVFFGVFNLIAAVFVENTLEHAKYNDQKQRQMKYSEHVQVAQSLQNLVMEICISSGAAKAKQQAHNENSQGLMKYYRKNRSTVSNAQEKLENYMNTKVSKHVFDIVMLDRDVQQMMDDLDVSVYNRTKLFDILDADGSGFLDVGELVDGIMRLRGPVEKGDVVAAALMVRSVQRGLDAFEAKMSERQMLAEHMQQELEVAVRDLKEQLVSQQSQQHSKLGGRADTPVFQ